MTRSTRTSWSASFPALPARASASSWLTRSTAVKKRTRAPLRTQLAPIVIAIWLLPVPVPPISTALRWVARKPPSCSSRTSPSLTGETVKSNSARFFITGKRHPHAVGDRAGAVIGQRGEQQLAEDALKGVLRAHPRGDHLVISGAHSGQFQLAQQLH